MPPIRHHGLPAYANRAGDPCFPPPYVVDEAGMDIFICEGDPAALQSMIDEALNVPTDRQYRGRRRIRFELADNKVGFACIDVKKLKSGVVETSGVPSLAGLPGVTSIYARQTEVAVMVQVRDDQGLPYWYLPYVLNNLPTAVTTGREIYGYPKQIAEFLRTGPEGERVRPGEDEVLFGPDRSWREREVIVRAFDIKLPAKAGEVEFAMCDVLGFRHGRFSPEVVGVQQVSVTHRPNPSDFEFYGDSAGVDDERPRTMEPDPASLMSGPAAAQGPADSDAAAEFLQRIKSDIPYAFLRQFRDPDTSGLASYQAVVIGRLVPNSADMLRSAPPDFTLVMPWAYNLALPKQIFGWTQKVGDPTKDAPRAKEAPVIGLLSGDDATFDVPRAAPLWQFDWNDRENGEAYRAFDRWREECRQEFKG